MMSFFANQNILLTDLEDFPSLLSDKQILSTYFSFFQIKFKQNDNENTPAYKKQL